MHEPYGLNEIVFDKGHMIMLPEGRAHPVMSFRDLLDIIAFYCGQDLRNVVRDAFRDLLKEKEDLEIEIEDYRRTLECNGEEERELLLAIRDEAEAMLDALKDTRLSRRKIQKTAKSIYEMVNAEL